MASPIGAPSELRTWPATPVRIVDEGSLVLDPLLACESLELDPLADDAGEGDARRSVTNAMRESRAAASAAAMTKSARGRLTIAERERCSSPFVPGIVHARCPPRVTKSDQARSRSCSSSGKWAWRGQARPVRWVPSPGFTPGFTRRRTRMMDRKIAAKALPALRSLVVHPRRRRAAGAAAARREVIASVQRSAW